MSTDERWLPVPGLDGYDVSDQGRIQSTRRAGKPRIMRAGRGPCGYHVVSIQMNPRGVRARAQPLRVGSLVMAAFVGPKPDGLVVRHVNGNLLDDRLENLKYGTPEEVRADMAARARREEAAGAPTHCPKGHRFSNSYQGAYGERVCRACERDRRAQFVGVRTGACIDCGTALRSRVTPAPAPKRCEPCTRKAHNEAAARFRDRHRVVRVRQCLDCEEQITQTGPGAPRLRCDVHREAAKLAGAKQRWIRRSMKLHTTQKIEQGDTAMDVETLKAWLDLVERYQSPEPSRALAQFRSSWHRDDDEATNPIAAMAERNGGARRIR